VPTHSLIFALMSKRRCGAFFIEQNLASALFLLFLSPPNQGVNLYGSNIMI